jgi:hypothetical protein
MTEDAATRRPIWHSPRSAVPLDADTAQRQTALSGKSEQLRALTDKSDFRYFVDRAGRQHFNFAQRIWLDPAIEMAFTRVQTLALETLALNLLTFMTRERDHRAAVGITSHRAVVLAPEFCADCLRSAPPEAWELPRAAIKAWLDSHRPESAREEARSRRSKNRCARRPR